MSTCEYARRTIKPAVPCTVRQKALVKKNEKLAVWMAKRLARRIHPAAMPYEEILSECYLAMVEAAKHFDPTRGFTFSTYATTTMYREVSKAAARRNRHMDFGLRISSLDGMTDGCRGGRTQGDPRHPFEFPDRPRGDPEGAMHDAEELEWARKQVPSRWWDCMVQRARGMTLREIAKEQGVTKERVRQMTSRAAQKICRLRGAV